MTRYTEMEKRLAEFDEIEVVQLDKIVIPGVSEEITDEESENRESDPLVIEDTEVKEIEGLDISNINLNN